MAPFFLDVWMEAAAQNQETVAVTAEKVTAKSVEEHEDDIHGGWRSGGTGR